MDTWTFWLAVAIYMIAGAVILKCFRKMKMRVAFGCFSVLFITLAMYIPAVIGSGAWELLSRPLIVLPEGGSVHTVLLALSPYFTVASIAIAVFSLILGIATVILSVMMVHRVARFLRRAARKPLSPRQKKERRSWLVSFPGKTKHIYIELCRLLD